MRYSKTMAIALASGLVATSGLAQPVSQGGKTFTTDLTGAVEVPGPGDPDGSGTATIKINPGQKRVCFELSVTGIAAPTAAHIHEAPAGQAGPVVVTLATPAGTSDPRTSQGCVDTTSREAAEILSKPADYYVNVHNAEFPLGALRGQLSKK